MSSSLSDSVRNRSNSEEDAELPTHDRKRARLSESGDNDSLLPDLTVSAAEDMTDTHSPPPPDPTHSQSAKPALPPRPSETMATPSPTSKVTINTRPLSSQSMNIADNSPPNEITIDPSLISTTPAANEAIPQHADGQDSEAPTVEMTPSPTIEIAEPEDYDQDPSQTRWTTRIGSAVSGITSYHVYQTFPLASHYRPGESRHAITAIYRIFSDARKEEGEVFRQVKDWFVDFATNCDCMTQEIIDQDPIFWRKLPLLLEGLWRRDQRNISPVSIQDMVDFFDAYGQICRLVLEYDTARLSSLQDASPPSDFYTLGGAYLQPFAYIVEWLGAPPQTRPALFFDSLRRNHDFDLLTLAKPFAESLAQSLLESVDKFVRALGDVLPRAPALHRDLLNVSALLTLAVQLLYPVFFSSFGNCPISQGHPLQDRIRELVESLVVKIDDIVQVGIKKQHSWLSFDNNATLLIHRLDQIMSPLATEIPRLGQSIIHAAGVTFEDADLTDLASTMPFAWKFTIFWKFIKYGRMELRVSGVSSLCESLVHIFTIKIQNTHDGGQDPLVRFVIRFLRQNNVIDYLIGPDSHPQLIGRAGNLIGFFGVAGAYTDSDTDSIWKAILESPDARVSAELIKMLTDALATMAVPSLYYICEKLSELPYDRWNFQVLGLTESLLGYALQRRLHTPNAFWFSPPVDPVVRRLCLKLIRDALQPTTCDADLSVKIRQNFVDQWINFFKGISDDPRRLAISEDEENEMLARIRSDIESHNESACGSMFAISHVLQNSHVNPVGMRAIIDKCGFPRCLIDDLAHISNSDISGQVRSSSQAFLQFDSRLNCLSFLMLTVPDKFDMECLESLWTSVLVSTRIDQQTRTQAWEHLNSLVNTYRPKENAVADAVLQHFWSRLRPSDINNAVLEFAKNSVSYDSAFMDQSGVPESDIVQIPGLDRVRQIMLDAEPGTVETAATEFIIEQYLRNPILAQRPKSVVHATHLNLIDHWVGAVLGSAAQLKSFSDQEDSMQMIATEDEIRREERHFDRSLLFLRRFTEAIKGNPGCSPLSPRQEEAFPEFPNTRGATRDIIVEVGSNKYVVTGERKVSVGSENTGTELWQYLAMVTGFSSFKVFHLGQSVNLQDEPRSIEELNIMAKVQVQKTPDAVQTMPQKRMRSSSPVDEKIMLHFDDLYGLLEADDRLAREVYQFLTITSVRKEVSHKIREMETPATAVLPCEKPYKLLFCVQALRTCIEEESFSATPDLTFVPYTVEALTSALGKLGSSDFNNSLQLYVVYELIETLLLAFRAKVPHGTGKAYIADQPGFVQHIIHYTASVEQVGGASLLPQGSEKPVRAGIEVLIEAGLHDDRLWQHLAGKKSFVEIFQYALIDDREEKLRQSIVDILMGLTGQAGLKNQPKANDPRAARSRHDSATIESCLLQIWSLLVELLPAAQASSFQCQQYFDATLGVLRRIGKILDVQVLATLFPQWSASLLAHKHVEVVGQPLADRFVAGMVPVLQEFTRLLRTQQSLSKQSMLMEGLITKFLRPPLSDRGALTVHLPILDATVRESIYNLLLMITQDAADLGLLVTEFGEDFDVSDHFPVAVSNERLALRSEVGYSGLRNLSNTCYLNSLLSQLFMNVQLRELILDYGAEARNQKLVWELSKVFAYMQNGHDKSVDPSAAVESITTWDGEQIDVTVQMDVDEFFNLLFDRLESQIMDPATRTRLKSFYSGETIQQIKSKECEHISERPETFSVLPVEIKGKASLQESLQAYVAGEVLQGDNKYSCTSCGKHVDAVKRSCLKHVPDNLIFNLKRFDFDLVTFMRAKLNDQFEFPDTLDMAPYQLENLNGNNESQTPDIFELTGIIVHSGTAETGHYYSFIRQRPSANDAKGSWVQFNDSDVTAFDPSTIGDCCFGGVDASIYNMAKFFNAYMLFYQRRTNIQATEASYSQTEPGLPLRLSVTPDVQEYIDKENEMFVRAYCMQDPVHARFLRELLRRISELDSGSCSDSHELETAVLKTALDYIHKVSTRWKLQPEVETTANIIRGLVGRCRRCAWACLQWFSENDQVVLESIIRGFYITGRKTLTSLLITCLQPLQKAVDDEEVSNSATLKYYNALEQLIMTLHQAFQLVSRTARCWSEYFPLVIAISELGSTPAKMVVEAGFIGRCFEIIHLHTLEAPDTRLDRLLRSHYSGYVALREKHRPFNHVVLVQCFAHLFSKVKIVESSEDEEQYAETDEILLPQGDMINLGLDRTPAQLSWLQRLIHGRQAPEGVYQVVARLASDMAYADDVAKVLQKGLEHRDMPLAAMYVEPALSFCEHCCNEDLAQDFAVVALGTVDSIGVDYAPEYLRLVQGLGKLGNTHPNVLQEEGWLMPLVQREIGKWAAPLILGVNETTCNVRNEALHLVNALLFAPLDEEQDESSPRYQRLRNKARQLAHNISRCGRTHFLNANPRENQTMQLGHFNEAMEVVDRCLNVVYSNVSTAEEESEYAVIDETMTLLRSKRESIVELISPNDFDGSSDMEALSEIEADEFNSSPAC